MIWVLLLLGVAAIPFVVERTRRPMNTAERATAPGQFARLSGGMTHYEWHGPAEGPVVICVHGLTTPSFVWGGMVTGLTGMGYRVLTYDLYGRGYSDRPGGTQDALLFSRQLSGLMADQKVPTPVTLIGYSMGGAIVSCFSARHPERVSQLVLLAPAGMSHNVGAKIKFLRDWRGIGDWLMLALYPRTHRAGIAAEAAANLPSSVPNITGLQENELKFRGFVPAVLSSLRGILSRDLQPEHAAIAAARIPTIAIWGREDTVIPLGASDTLAGWNPDAKQEIIEGGDHALTYSHTAEILHFLTPHLHRPPPVIADL